MWILLESLTAAVVVFCYVHNVKLFGLIRLIDKLSWIAFDRCPGGYKGRQDYE